MREPTAEPTNGNILAGVEFKKLENNLEGRQLLATLTRLVGELQRTEISEFREGLAKAG